MSANKHVVLCSSGMGEIKTFDICMENIWLKLRHISAFFSFHLAQMLMGGSSYFIDSFVCACANANAMKISCWR